jgi:phosphotransferase system enzyme I (PtsI)
MLARSRGVPMVVGLAAIPDWARHALVDGAGGIVTFDPEPATHASFEAALAAECRSGREADRHRLDKAAMADGTPIAVMINIAGPDDLIGLDPRICDGVGLVRTEFLFHGTSGLPDEETQFEAYRRIVQWAEGRPVTIRTLDAGGDKPIRGVTLNGESNPFLGLRGIRLSLLKHEIFTVQLRALARAAVCGNVRVMVPMVTATSELDQAARLLDAAVEALGSAGVAHARPELGMMVEVPAAALCAADFDAAFYSIGSNDLTQYTMAAARDIGAVAALADAGHPAVIELVRRTVEAGRSRGVPVSVCGDAAADLSVLPPLLRAGVRILSVAPIAVGRVKAAIAGFEG